MKRELLFDGVLEAEAEAKANTPRPRVFDSVYDIPPGTLVKPATRKSHLYVTSRGQGWWINPDREGIFAPEIALVEESGSGWTIGQDAATRAPFLEVLQGI